MSTYYWMGCDKHKKRTEKMIAVGRLEGSHIDNHDHLLDFLLRHRDCDLRFFSEFDDDRYKYEKEKHHPRVVVAYE